MGKILLVGLLLFGTETLIIAQDKFQFAFGGTGEDEATEVVQTSDGGYIIAGITNSYGAGGNDALLIKLSSSGVIEWTNTYGGTGDDRAYDVYATSDGGYILTGLTASYGSGLMDVFVVKTTSLGAISWTKAIGGANDDLGRDVEETSDGGYIIAGTSKSFGGFNEGYLVKLDAAGTLEWSETIGGATENEHFRNVKETSTGDFIVCGENETHAAGLSQVDWYIVKVSSLGALIWSKLYGGPGSNDRAYDLDETSDGGFIVSGQVADYGPSGRSAWLMKIDVDGNWVWSHEFGGSGGATDNFGSLEITSDGGYIMAGHSATLGAGSNDGFVVRTNSIGDTLWTRCYGGTGSDYFSDCRQTSDGGFIFAGQTYTVGSGSKDIYLVKTDSEGNSGNCLETIVPTIRTTTPPASTSGAIIGTGGVVVTPSPSISSPSVGSMQISLDVSTSVTTDYSGEDISCNGLSDGEVTATPIGGTSPFSYQWDDASSQTTAVASGLSAGEYHVVLSDLFCSVTDTIIITEPTLLTAVGSVTSNYNGEDISCNGICDGEVTITETGGTGPFTGDGVFSGLCDGSASYTVTDANGCTSSISVTVNEPTAVTSSASITSDYNGEDISCNGVCDGEVTITGGGGAPTYTGDGVFTGLCDGSFGYTVTDANGCTSTGSITITEPAELAASGSVTSNYSGEDISCNGICDGEVTITETGGTGPFTGDGVFSGLCDGSASYTVTDANGCTSSISVTVNEPTAVTSSASITSDYNGEDISCNGVCDGEVTITGGGGTPTYTGDGVFTGLCDGSFGYTVTDANGCTSTGSITITEPAELAASGSVTSNYSGEDISCNGVCDGEVTITETGGTGPFTGDGVFTGLCDGSASYTVTDANGCNSAITVTVTEPPLLTIAGSITSDYNGEDISCFGECDGEVTLTGGGGTPTYTGDGVVSGICVGDNVFTVTDANGCTADITIVLTEPDELVASISASTDATCFEDCDGEATVVETGGVPTYTYLWDDPSAQTTLTATGLCAGDHDVTVSDLNGCTDIVTVTIDQPAQIDTSVLVSGFTLTANASGLEYQWINCVDSSEIFGATGMTYNALLNGMYAVIITDGPCVDTSGCHRIEGIHVNGFTENDLNIKVYPNPTSGKVVIELDKVNDVQLMVLNPLGQVIQEMNNPQGKITIDLAGLANGAYLLKVHSELSVKVIRLIKE